MCVCVRDRESVLGCQNGLPCILLISVESLITVHLDTCIEGPQIELFGSVNVELMPIGTFFL